MFEFFARWTGLFLFREAFKWIVSQIGVPGVVMSLTGGIGAAIWATISQFEGIVILLITLFSFLVFLWIFIGIHHLWIKFWRYRDTKENRMLVQSLLKLSREMLNTVTDDDKRSNAKLYSRKTDEYLEHSDDAKAAYERRFLGRVEDAAQILIKEQLLDEKDVSGHSINPIVRKEAAAKIEAAARQYARKCRIDPDHY